MLGGKIKQCPNCKEWFDLNDILKDPCIKPIGMMLEDKFVKQNLYFFNHNCEGCGTTFTISVEQFRELLSEDIYSHNNAGSPTCEGKCLDKNDTSECKQNCKWASYRRFLQVLMKPRNQREFTELFD